MNWPQLLSLKKHGDTAPRLRNQQDELRLGFEVDYDRIIFSSQFRSLQDKTQVIPLSQTGFVHTRLTHSLEVSVVGRSLGRMAGQKILERHPDLVDLGYKHQDFGAIVAAAALSHDIGNPPFGHSGEKAIGSYFSSEKGNAVMSSLSRKQQQDLLDFEGNANGYRLLNMNKPGSPGGLRLSYATLGAFVKYPKESLPKKPTSHISQKKYGIFQSDVPHFEDVAMDMGLKNTSETGEAYHRHPLTYLVEAADDICYTIIDFEDAINLGNIPEDHALEQLINLVRDNIKTETYSILSSTSERLAYLRALAIGTLITDCVETFMKHEKEILAGTLSHSLTDLSKYKPQIDDILALTVENLYQHPDVVQKEVAGYKILREVLDAVITASMNELHGQESSYDKLILQLTPDEVLASENLYDRLLAACGYVASLTDTKSVKLFEIINGRI
ncbi:dGTP triphosphohydrolase [Nonlabens marinus]|uniref:Deoxyguanosinetriphosphate triphosphohydrolase n=1 Tax=Nonlabens marinus S1-08 TaxID=1454201 RepID=W8VPJ9_9FLAO|nr:dNTP triphosphohydrolase [Nonlabens marinus]BAO55089.1 deoxyguanosinetriphosphate triphosphohydrolase [Nonlabens marinus S1-08]